jgi:hypothetical protein
MAGRIRSTKKLAQRINLEYFKTLHGIPRWRRYLSVVLVVLGIMWLGWRGLSGKPTPFNAGPVAHAHAMFGQKCAACHVSKGGFQQASTDEACLACHDGPIHHESQTFTPLCMDCHVEHKGAVRLAAATDRACTQCHADLKSKDAPAKIAKNISGFDLSHPEFAALLPGQSDPGTIKFNHAVHLDAKKGIRGPHGMVQLKCDDCHRAAGTRPASKSYMEPVNYEKHCASCHTMQFDRRFQESVPHKDPKIVYDFAQKKLTEYIAVHPNEIHTVDEPDKRLPARPVPPIPRNAQEWIAQHMDDAELLLWRKSCKECHGLSYASGEHLPVVAKAAVTTRWLQHGNFDHQAHQMVACASCHAKASTSKETSDVLIPSVQVCRDCHHSGENAAESRCFECHSYHDWTKEKRAKGAFSVLQLTQ